jgi:leucine dehydrogenase
MRVIDFSSRSTAGHERVVRISDAASGLDAIVAIHSTALGPAFGGCRMKPYRSRDEALRDALRLSRAMSLKTAFAGLPFGGGKCVVIGSPATQKSEALLLALGQALNELGGTYLTADDSGTSVMDMEVMRRVTPYARGLPQANGAACPAAAYGTYLAIKAAVAHRFGRGDLAGVHVAVQGLGALGLRLCRYLHEAGCRLTVSDTDPVRVAMAVAEFGAQAVAPEEIMSVGADVLSPNALGGVINDDTVPLIRAPVVAGAANNQLHLPRHGIGLYRRGITLVPDFVANVGGVIDVALEGPGYSEGRVLEACGDIYGNVAGLLAEADRVGVAPFVLAERMALDRIAGAERCQGVAVAETAA